MLLFSAFSLSHSNLLSPTLPLQLNYIYLIPCMHEEKAGFLCHPAAAGAGGFQRNAEYRRWRGACRGSGRRTGVHGREGGSTGISTPLGFCWGCHISVTGVVYDWHSIFSSVEPHLVAFLHHFLCVRVCPCVCFRDFSSSVLANWEREGRTRCLRKGRARRGTSASLPVPGCNLEIQKLSRLMSFPAALPCCAISPRVARNDLIVLAKPQFVL